MIDAVGPRTDLSPSDIAEQEWNNRISHTEETHEIPEYVLELYRSRLTHLDEAEACHLENC